MCNIRYGVCIYHVLWIIPWTKYIAALPRIFYRSDPGLIWASELRTLKGKPRDSSNIGRSDVLDKMSIEWCGDTSRIPSSCYASHTHTHTPLDWRCVCIGRSTYTRYGWIFRPSFKSWNVVDIIPNSRWSIVSKRVFHIPEPNTSIWHFWAEDLALQKPAGSYRVLSFLDREFEVRELLFLVFFSLRHCGLFPVIDYLRVP